MRVVTRGRMHFPFQPSGLEPIARRQGVVIVERISPMIEERDGTGLGGPRAYILRLANGNGDAAAIRRLQRRIAAHVVGMAMGVDEAGKRLALQAFGAPDPFERARSVRA